MPRNSQGFHVGGFVSFGQGAALILYVCMYVCLFVYMYRQDVSICVYLRTWTMVLGSALGDSTG